MPNTKVLAALALSASLTACSADDTAPQPDVLALPGAAYYPESLHADADGALYVGSLATGEVVAFDDGASAPRTVVAAGGGGVTGVHIAGDTLWLCSVDTTFQRPTELRSYTLAGAALASYPLPATAFCNDIEVDAQGSVYATDSFGGAIYTLADGAVTPLVQDVRFTPDSQGAFGLDGIAVADGALIVNKLDTGELFRVGFDGAVTDISLAAPLAGPDGMRVDTDGTLLVIEGQAGRLSRVSIAGNVATATTVADGLDMPTGVVVARGSAWISEGQLGRLFAQPAQAPNLPFAVRRVSL